MNTTRMLQYSKYLPNCTPQSLSLPTFPGTVAKRPGPGLAPLRLNLRCINLSHVMITLIDLPSQPALSTPEYTTSSQSR